MRDPPFKKVAIFVDNSGPDIVLGVLPFVRELLRQNSKVRINFLNNSQRFFFLIRKIFLSQNFAKLVQTYLKICFKLH